MTTAKAGTLAAAGYAIEFERLPGRHPGPTLVLLHEGLGCVAMWRRFPNLLNEATGLPVLSYSRPGYGRSSSIALPRPLDFHSRDALDVLPHFLDAAAIEDCVLVGHSDGASIAVVYAGAMQDPRVRALVLIAPHVLTEEKTVMNIAAAKRSFEGTDLRAKLARYHGENVDCAFWGWCDAWLDADFRRWDITPWLPAIKLPVLTVRGEDDAYNTAVHVERIASGVSGPVTHVDVPDCGHAPHLEQGEAVVVAVSLFLTQIGAAHGMCG